MLTVTAATSSNRDAALRLLFARFPVEEQATRLREALSATEQGRLDLSGLLLAESDGLPVGATLVMRQPDGIALVWPPVVSCGAEDASAVEDALLDEACRLMDATDSNVMGDVASVRHQASENSDAGSVGHDHANCGELKFGQALLTPDDVVEARVLERHGFVHATDIFFLARTITPDDASLIADDTRAEPLLASRTVSITKYDEDLTARFAAVIEQSYQHSLDCLYLKDFRNGADAIESHKLSGVFEPSNWLLFSIDDRDAGVLLLNEHPDQDAIELVYIGVTPELRGLGLGRRMLREGVRRAAQRARAAMFLAVDCENRYANALYSELSFAELARRRVMLRQPRGLARQ